jgi:hypothetical protein
MKLRAYIVPSLVLLCQGCASFSLTGSMERQIKEPVKVAIDSISSALGGNENRFLFYYVVPEGRGFDIIRCEKDMRQIQKIFRQFAAVEKKKDDADFLSDTETAKRELQRLALAVNAKGPGNQMNARIDSTGGHCGISIILEEAGVIKAGLVKSEKDEWLIDQFQFEEAVKPREKIEIEGK